MRGRRAREERRTAETDTELRDRCFDGGADVRVRRQAEVVVRAQHEHRALLAGSRIADAHVARRRAEDLAAVEHQPLLRVRRVHAGKRRDAIEERALDIAHELAELEVLGVRFGLRCGEHAGRGLSAHG